MKKTVIQRFEVIAISGLLALVCAGVFVWWWRIQSQTLLLYVTTLPAEPGQYSPDSIAVLSPTSRSCGPPVFLDRALTDVHQLRWSPKRDRIVYTTFSMSDGSTSLWVMKGDGSERQPILLRAPGELYEADLSADEDYVAYIKPIEPTEQETWETWVWDRRDGSMRQVMTATFQIAWSPRNQLIAIDRWGDSRLYIVRADGMIVDAFDPGMVVQPGLVWSPDGGRISFASDGADTPAGGPRFVAEIYTLDLTTRQVHQVTHSGGGYSERDITRLSWSRNGKRIAFVARVVGPGESDRRNVLFVLDLTSGREIEVADQVAWSTPVWSPDSQQLAYVSTKDGTTYGQIYRVDVNSGDTIQLTCDNNIKTSLSW